MKYWLKGGLILSILSIIILFLRIPSINLFIGYPVNIFLSFFPKLKNSITMGIWQGQFNSGLIAVILISLLFTFFFWFLLGAIIGWIYGRIRNIK